MHLLGLYHEFWVGTDDLRVFAAIECRSMVATL